MAIAKVEQYNGAPALIIDGKPYPPMYATIRTINGEKMVIDEEYYRKIVKASPYADRVIGYFFAALFFLLYGIFVFTRF